MFTRLQLLVLHNNVLEPDRPFTARTEMDSRLTDLQLCCYLNPIP